MGYTMPRRNYLWGRWLRYGGLYPDYQIRLFKRGKGEFQGAARARIGGDRWASRAFAAPLEHHSYQGIGDVIQRLDRYTELAALDLRDQGQPFRWSQHWSCGL